MPRFAPEVEALLAHERTIPPPYDFTRARVLARARKSLKDGSLGSFPLPTLANHHLPYAAFAGLALVIATAAFQVLRSTTKDAATNEQPVAGEQRTATDDIALPSQETPSAQAAEASTTGPREEAVLPPAKKPATKRDLVIEELVLLERAQLAAARNDHATVLVIAHEHELRYPKGRLNEEREALRVRAMIGLGQLGEARQTAARFHRSFPRSVLLSRLDDLLVSR